MRRTALSLLLLALVSCDGHYEEQEFEVGFWGEAESNPLLMVERWAQELGCESDTRTDWLDNTFETCTGFWHSR